MISAAEAKKKLMEGNRKYLDAKAGEGDVSLQMRRKTAEEGQEPYADLLSGSAVVRVSGRWTAAKKMKIKK